MGTVREREYMCVMMPWQKSEEETQPRLEKVGDEDELKAEYQASISVRRESWSLGRGTWAEGLSVGSACWVDTGPEGK